jgi:hypothetical protein
MHNMKGALSSSVAKQLDIPAAIPVPGNAGSSMGPLCAQNNGDDELGNIIDDKGGSRSLSSSRLTNRKQPAGTKSKLASRESTTRLLHTTQFDVGSVASDGAGLQVLASSIHVASLPDPRRDHASIPSASKSTQSQSVPKESINSITNQDSIPVRKTSVSRSSRSLYSSPETGDKSLSPDVTSPQPFPEPIATSRAGSVPQYLKGSGFASATLDSIDVTKAIVSRSHSSSSKLRSFTDHLVTKDSQLGTSSEAQSMRHDLTSSMHSFGSQDSIGSAHRKSSKSPKSSSTFPHTDERSMATAFRLGSEDMCKSVPNLTQSVYSMKRQNDSSSVEHLFSRPSSYYQSTNDLPLRLRKSSRSSSVPNGLADTLHNMGRKDSSLMARQKMRRSVQCSTANAQWVTKDFEQCKGFNDPMYSRTLPCSIAVAKTRIPISASRSLPVLDANEQLAPIDCSLLSNHAQYVPRGKLESLQPGNPLHDVLRPNKYDAESPVPSPLSNVLGPELSEQNMNANKSRSRSSNGTFTPEKISSKSAKNKHSRSLSPSDVDAAPTVVSLINAQSSEHEVSEVPKQSHPSQPSLPKRTLKGPRSKSVPKVMTGTSSSNDCRVPISASSQLLIRDADEHTVPDDIKLLSNQTKPISGRKPESFDSRKSLDSGLAAERPVILSQLDNSSQPVLHMRSKKSRSRSSDCTLVSEKMRSKSAKNKHSRSLSPSDVDAAPTVVSLVNTQSSEHEVSEVPKQAHQSQPRLPRRTLKGARSMSVHKLMTGTSSSDDCRVPISASSQLLIPSAGEHMVPNDIKLLSNQTKSGPRRKPESFDSGKPLNSGLAAERPVEDSSQPVLHMRSMKSRSRSNDGTFTSEKIRSKSAKNKHSRSLSPSVLDATPISLLNARSSEHEQVSEIPKKAQPSQPSLQRRTLKGARSMSVPKLMTGTSSCDDCRVPISASSQLLIPGSGEHTVPNDINLLSNQTTSGPRCKPESFDPGKSLDSGLAAERPVLLSQLDNSSQPVVHMRSKKSRSRSSDGTFTSEKIRSKSTKNKHSRSLSPSVLSAAPTFVSLVNTRNSEHEASEVPKQAQPSQPRLPRRTLKGARSMSMPRCMTSSSLSDDCVDERLTLGMHRSRSPIRSKNINKKKKGCYVGKSRSLSPTNGMWEEEMLEDSDSLAEIKAFFREVKQAHAKSSMNDSGEPGRNDCCREMHPRKEKVPEQPETIQPSTFKAAPESLFIEKPLILSDDLSWNELEAQLLPQSALDFSRSRTVKPTPRPSDAKDHSSCTMPWQEMAQALSQNCQNSIRLEDIEQHSGQLTPNKLSQSVSPLTNVRCDVQCQGEGELQSGFRDYVTYLSDETSQERELPLNQYLRFTNENDCSSCEDDSMNSADLLNIMNGSVQVDDSIRITNDDSDMIESSLSPKVVMSPHEILALLEAENKQDMPERVPCRDSGNTNKMAVMCLPELADILNHVATRHSNNDEIRWDVIARMAQEGGNEGFDPQRPFEYVGGDATDEDSDASSLSLEGIDETTDFWNSGGSNQWHFSGLLEES